MTITDDVEYLDPPDESDIHTWFGLTYANYLVLPRSVLQSMPSDWQRDFVKLLEELQDATREIEIPDTYAVQVRDARGRFVADPVEHYNRGRTWIRLRKFKRCSRDCHEAYPYHDPGCPRYFG